MKFSKLLIITLSLLFVSTAFAQQSTGSIRGFVYLKDTGEPMLDH